MVEILHHMEGMYRQLISNHKRSRKAYFDKYFFIVHYFFRPASLLITPLFLKLRISANAVTYASFAVGLLSLVAFGSGEQRFRLGFGLIVLAYLLDHVDGNIARFSKSSSYFGKFIDGLADSLLGALIPFAIGMGLYSSGRPYFENISFWDNSYFLVIGALIGVLSLFSNLAETKFTALKNERLLNAASGGNASESAGEHADH